MSARNRRRYTPELGDRDIKRNEMKHRAEAVGSRMEGWPYKRGYKQPTNLGVFWALA